MLADLLDPLVFTRYQEGNDARNEHERINNDRIQYKTKNTIEKRGETKMNYSNEIERQAMALKHI